MNLLDIPDCPLAEADIEALLRALLWARERSGRSVTFEWCPHMQVASKWDVFMHGGGVCCHGSGNTLEAAIEAAFKVVQRAREGAPI